MAAVFYFQHLLMKMDKLRLIFHRGRTKNNEAWQGLPDFDDQNSEQKKNVLKNDSERIVKL